MAAIRAPWCSDPDLLALVKALRSQGERVVYELPGEKADGDCRALRKHDAKWHITENN